MDRYAFEAVMPKANINFIKLENNEENAGQESRADRHYYARDAEKERKYKIPTQNLLWAQ